MGMAIVAKAQVKRSQCYSNVKMLFTQELVGKILFVTSDTGEADGCSMDIAQRPKFS